MVKDIKEILTENGIIALMVISELEFKTGLMDLTTQFTFNGNGETSVAYHVKLLNMFPSLARFGVEFAVPSSFNHLSWFGRGPFESYSDRKESTHIGLYSGKVADQFFPYVMP